jgi:ubiquinone/menaquinone biosynthesis C-methylase UbiE
MDTDYSDSRLSKNHLIYRFQFRADETLDAYCRHRNLVSTPVSLVDFGAAEGRTLERMAEKLGYRGTFTGIEYSNELIAASPKQSPGVKLMQGDVCHLESQIAENSTDLVTALAVLEHLPNPVSALKEARRILKPGGLFIATCPSPFWDGLAGRFGLMKNEYHECAFDEAQFRKVTSESGLEFIEYRQFMWVLTAYLPYLKIPIDVSFSRHLDSLLRALPLSSWQFINQLMVARKPNP